MRYLTQQVVTTMGRQAIDLLMPWKSQKRVCSDRIHPVPIQQEAFEPHECGHYEPSHFFHVDPVSVAAI
jgi:hypothetical protein